MALFLALSSAISINLSILRDWWDVKASNLGPSGYEPDALAN